MADRFDKLRELEAKATKGPWWQVSHAQEAAPIEGARELSSLLCYFEDEGEPRFWAYTTDGEFVCEARNQVRALLEERDALVEALRPFAEYAEDDAEFSDGDGKPLPDNVQTWPTFTLGDFRHALAALTRAEEQEKADA